MPVQSQQSEWSCIWVRRFDFASICDFPIGKFVAYLTCGIFVSFDLYKVGYYKFINLKSHDGYCWSCMYNIIALFSITKIYFTDMVHDWSEEIRNCYIYSTKWTINCWKMYCETELFLQTENGNGNFRSKQTCIQIIMITCSTVSNKDITKIQL